MVYPVYLFYPFKLLKTDPIIHGILVVASTNELHGRPSSRLVLPPGHTSRHSIGMDDPSSDVRTSTQHQHATTGHDRLYTLCNTRTPHRLRILLCRRGTVKRAHFYVYERRSSSIFFLCTLFVLLVGFVSSSDVSHSPCLCTGTQQGRRYDSEFENKLDASSRSNVETRP